MDIGSNGTNDDLNTPQAGFSQAAATGYSRASAALSQGIAEAGTKMEKNAAQLREQMGKAVKVAEDVASFNQGTVDALVKSGQIWAAGLQELSKQLTSTAQGQIEHSLAMFKSMSGMRSMKDVVELQTSFVRASVEKAMAETGRLTDAGFKLAEETIAPVTARVGAAVETFAKAG